MTKKYVVSCSHEFLQKGKARKSFGSLCYVEHSHNYYDMKNIRKRIVYQHKLYYSYYGLLQVRHYAFQELEEFGCIMITRTASISQERRIRKKENMSVKNEQVSQKTYNIYITERGSKVFEVIACTMRAWCISLALDHWTNQLLKGYSQTFTKCISWKY